MTAIFAYVSSDVAFVAGDSARTVPLWGPVKAMKVHAWTDKVVFAQAGDGMFISQLIQAAKLSQPWLPAQYPNRADDERLLEILRHFWPTQHAKAMAAHSKTKSSPGPSGTVLVASAADQFGRERINSFDFATGTYKQVAGPLAADGTSPGMFTSLAQTALSIHQVAGSTFPIDRWALDCIDQAVATFSPAVDWPANLLLARSSSAGRVTVTRQVSGRSAIGGVPEFEI